MPFSTINGVVTLIGILLHTRRVRSREGADDGRRADWELCHLSDKTLLQSEKSLKKVFKRVKKKFFKKVEKSF